MTAALDRISLELVLFFLLLHIANQIDRQLVAAFAADIMRDLDMSRSQFALIAGLAFSGVAAWSLFTALAGLAQGFWTMLATRPLVAAGEATLVPTAFNIILARTPDRHKAAAIGLFFAGIPLGIDGLAMAIGVGSDWLAGEGRADAWTWPLLGADLIAFTSLGFLWGAYSAESPFNTPGRTQVA